MGAKRVFRWLAVLGAVAILSGLLLGASSKDLRVNPRAPADVVDKFGRVPGVAAGDTADVWDGGGRYTWISGITTLYASSSATADVQLFSIIGLDSLWKEQTKTVTLAGRTKTAIPGRWRRAHRAYNDGSVDLAGDVYIYEDDTVTDGVPDTATLIRAKVLHFMQQTLMSIYTVPDGYRGYMTAYTLTLNRQASSPQSREVDIWIMARKEGKVFLVKRVHGLSSDGSSVLNEHCPTGIPGGDGFASKTDLLVRTAALGQPCDVSAVFTVELVKV